MDKGNVQKPLIGHSSWIVGIIIVVIMVLYYGVQDDDTHTQSQKQEETPSNTSDYVRTLMYSYERYDESTRLQAEKEIKSDYIKKLEYDNNETVKELLSIIGQQCDNNCGKKEALEKLFNFYIKNQPPYMDDRASGIMDNIIIKGGNDTLNLRNLKLETSGEVLMRNINFINVDLSNARFSGIINMGHTSDVMSKKRDGGESEFINVNLTSSVFNGVDLQDAKFQNTNLSNAKFLNSYFTDTYFEDSDLTNAVFTSDTWSYTPPINIYNCYVKNKSLPKVYSTQNDYKQGITSKTYKFILDGKHPTKNGYYLIKLVNQ